MGRPVCVFLPLSSGGKGDVIMYPDFAGCAKRPSALVCATVAAAGWPYEFPRDGSLEVPPMEPRVEGLAVDDTGDAACSAFDSETARGGSRAGRDGGGMSDCVVGRC